VQESQQDPAHEPAPVVTATSRPLPAAEHHSLAPESITTEIALPTTSAEHSSEPSLEIGTHYGADQPAPRDQQVVPTQPPAAANYGLESSRPTAPELSAWPAPALAPDTVSELKEPVAPAPVAAAAEEAAPRGAAWFSWLLALAVIAGVAWLAYKRYYLHQ